ncbi:MAG TPA: MOSC domain-containing protein [Mycobacteriales bacterium]|jgi:uncharacterized protein YcbX|nr:MOSC domain-containing protein [Mycobacteriales bacterium]
MTTAVRPTPPGRVVGHIAALWRYPVKSMAGHQLPEIHVDWQGLTGDRRWAFVRPDQEASGFPWLTIRERAQMWGYRPAFVEPDRPNSSPTVVVTPSGAELDVVDPRLAAELGAGVRVLRQDRGAFDTMPLSLITTQTVEWLSGLVEEELEMRRFRPNLVVESTDGGPLQEDTWVGHVLTVGDLRLRLDKHNKRCVIVNTDPVTAERAPRVLQTIAQERQAYLGVYGSTVQPGRVAVGDAVVLESPA